MDTQASCIHAHTLIPGYKVSLQKDSITVDHIPYIISCINITKRPLCDKKAFSCLTNAIFKPGVRLWLVHAWFHKIALSTTSICVCVYLCVCLPLGY